MERAGALIAWLRYDPMADGGRITDTPWHLYYDALDDDDDDGRRAWCRSFASSSGACAWAMQYAGTSQRRCACKVLHAHPYAHSVGAMNVGEGTRAELSAAQVELLARHGMPVPRPHRSTVSRRRVRSGERLFPVVARSVRTFREAHGQPYGSLPEATTGVLDAGPWRVSEPVRAALEPMTVAIGGYVERVYAVEAWEPTERPGWWVAQLGEVLSDAALDARWPAYPYRLGGECETRQGGAYRPESY